MKTREGREEKKREKKERTRLAYKARQRLLEDKEFMSFWSCLLESPKWQNKTPHAIGLHLDRLAQYPTEFAIYLVCGAVNLDLPFVVTDAAVERLFREWQRAEQR